GQIGELWVRLNILDVDGTPLEGGASGGAFSSGADGIPLEDLFLLLREVVGDHESKELTVETEDCRLHGLAQPDRVLGQCLEDGLEIERGPPDHLEQLAGRRLLIERNSELTVARLQFLEEAHVLDGNDGLIGKGLEQLDLFVRERSR